MDSLVSVPALTGHAQTHADRLRLAALAYLARYKGQSRDHAASDLPGYLNWSAERGVDPLTATRVQIEVWVPWMQETRGLRPATVSRRLSIIAGFYRTCVIDDILERSPAQFVRRPRVPPESPTLGFTHLQFEALLAAGRDLANRHDFALVAMLSLLGLRIFEACAVADLGDEHGHHVLRVHGKGDKIVQVPLPPAAKRAIDRTIDGRTSGPSCAAAPPPGWTATAPPGDYTA